MHPVPALADRTAFLATVVPPAAGVPLLTAMATFPMYALLAYRPARAAHVDDH